MEQVNERINKEKNKCNYLKINLQGQYAYSQYDTRSVMDYDKLH